VIGRPAGVRRRSPGRGNHTFDGYRQYLPAGPAVAYGGVVDNRSEIREFLTSRRARISPDEVGIPAYGDRRVAGLRRGEVAVMAGVSVEYYTRLERGNLRGVSDSVLDAVARALRLDDTERAHLSDLARVANASTAVRAGKRPASDAVRTGVRQLLAGMTMIPAFVRNNRFDILAVNDLGRALYAPLFTTSLTGPPHAPVNTVRFIFLDARAEYFYRDWGRVAADSVGALRVQAGRNPYDRDLSNLIGELATRSDDFRVRWGAHEVYVHGSAVKRFNHPAIGAIELAVEAMPLAGDAEQTLIAYSAEPGSPNEDALRLLASWSASPDSATPAAAELSD
jgi:transcriptional regulator with XRE-family HTH domain